MARVAVENLSKTFKGPKKQEIRAVQNVSFTAEDKEFLVLVGPSGCGKSTVLRLIAGLEEISEGKIFLDGKVINAVEPGDRDIAMVFQNYALYPHMTVHENMAFGLKLRKLARTEIERRVGDAATLLGLADCLDRKPDALSGGQRQRVAVGRALVRQPAVFLFDEPLSNLDAKMRAHMRREISRLHARLGSTMIYVTHDQIEAMTMGDRIVVMKEGVVQQIAEPMTVYRHPANKFVAEFIGSPPMNFFHGIIEQSNGETVFREDAKPGGVDTSGFTVRVDAEMAARLANYLGKKIILGIRPEDIAAPSSAPNNSSSETTVIAELEAAEPMGAETHLYLTTGAHMFVARVHSHGHPPTGKKISAAFNMRHAHFFDPATEIAVA